MCFGSQVLHPLPRVDEISTDFDSDPSKTRVSLSLHEARSLRWKDHTDHCACEKVLSSSSSSWRLNFSSSLSLAPLDAPGARRTSARCRTVCTCAWRSSSSSSASESRAEIIATLGSPNWSLCGEPKVARTHARRKASRADAEPALETSALSPALETSAVAPHPCIPTTKAQSPRGHPLGSEVRGRARGRPAAATAPL